MKKKVLLVCYSFNEIPSHHRFNLIRRRKNHAAIHVEIKGKKVNKEKSFASFQTIINTYLSVTVFRIRICKQTVGSHAVVLLCTVYMRVVTGEKERKKREIHYSMQREREMLNI